MLSCFGCEDGIGVGSMVWLGRLACASIPLGFIPMLTSARITSATIVSVLLLQPLDLWAGGREGGGEWPGVGGGRRLLYPQPPTREVALSYASPPPAWSWALCKCDEKIIYIFICILFHYSLHKDPLFFLFRIWGYCSSYAFLTLSTNMGFKPMYGTYLQLSKVSRCSISLYNQE